MNSWVSSKVSLSEYYILHIWKLVFSSEKVFGSRQNIIKPCLETGAVLAAVTIAGRLPGC